jgi:NRAMP (natural resistance-associated macrophage protein)-like metal ion transporter
MDPGNWATDIAGGSQFGYALLWVLLMSNIMALLLQSLSARLGIVTFMQAPEKPIRHLSIIYCILPKLQSQPAILPRF